MVAYLATDAAAGVNGQTFLVNGGLIARISDPAPARTIIKRDALGARGARGPFPALPSASTSRTRRRRSPRAELRRAVEFSRQVAKRPGRPEDINSMSSWWLCCFASWRENHPLRKLRRHRDARERLQEEGREVLVVVQVDLEERAHPAQHVAVRLVLGERHRRVAVRASESTGPRTRSGPRARSRPAASAPRTRRITAPPAMTTTSAGRFHHVAVTAVTTRSGSVAVTPSLG